MDKAHIATLTQRHSQFYLVSATNMTSTSLRQEVFRFDVKIHKKNLKKNLKKKTIWTSLGYTTWMYLAYKLDKVWLSPGVKGER